MPVVIVESPAKAKTINKYLGSDYDVVASYGHVRDLPAKDGSVRPDEDFSMSWELDSQSKKRIADIASLVKTTDKLVLATDPDREGEAISWHLLEALRAKKAIKKDMPIERVVFNAITKNAILEAMQNPRQIDQQLVDAYLARRALDYLVGFSLSPVLWRKLPGARSAGRVQSVSLRLVTERESEIEAFISEEYWSLIAGLKTAEGAHFNARLTIAEKGVKLGKKDIHNEEMARALEQKLQQASFQVDDINAKPAKRYPSPPFTTSTLQQEAARKLYFSSKRTMQTAQKLYEGVNLGGETVGLITYMRTDGVQMAPEAIHATRDVIKDNYGNKYLPEKPKFYATKAKNAQEAHEAIRPTSLARLPQHIRAKLDDDQFKLYELIWKRTIASQMEAAEFQRTTVDISATPLDGDVLGLRANGQVMMFDGFLTLYQEGFDDKNEDENEDDRRLPKMVKGENLNREKIEANQHFTEPPPRYTEASLIKKMEELGIGRPSTYTATLGVLSDRGYVRAEKNRLIPEDKGRLVISFLESFFTRYVQYDFTASLEEDLDKISAGELNWKAVLAAFWRDFSHAIDETKELRISHVLDALNELLGHHIFKPSEEGGDPRACPSCDNGQLSLKLSRYGAFIGCSNYPECGYTRQMGNEQGDQTTIAEEGSLGVDPETGQEVHLKSGRFGPYVQLGEGKEAKRAGLPKGMSPDQVQLDYALKLLSLPRLVGIHPETGQEILAGLGRYGPYVLHDKKYGRLSSVEEAFEVGLNRAVSVLAESKSRAPKASSALKELGEHPDGGAVKVMDGRYGPYVNYGKINATLPRGTDPQSVYMTMALELIVAKAAKGGGAKSKGRAKKK